MITYLIGIVVFFILSIFYIALIHNEKLREKYDSLREAYFCFDEMFFVVLLIATFLWPITLIVIFIIGLGFLLFKLFSKLIDYFMKRNSPK